MTPMIDCYRVGGDRGETPSISYSLNSLDSVVSGIIQGSIIGLLGKIFKVQTIAHMKG